MIQQTAKKRCEKVEKVMPVFDSGTYRLTGERLAEVIEITPPTRTL